MRIWGKRNKKTPSGTDRKVSKRQTSILAGEIVKNPTYFSTANK